jgi:trehalose 6-phosphate phosphatase
MKEAVLRFWEEVHRAPTKEQQLVMDNGKEAILTEYFEWIRTIDPRKWLFAFDYDGNLAPLDANPMQAFPYEGVVERLNFLNGLGVETAIITGGELARIFELLILAYPVPVVGNHGWEWGTSVENRQFKEVPKHKSDALDRVESWMYLAKRMGMGVWYERKHASLVLHWRNLIEAGEEETIARITQYMEGCWRDFNRRDILRYDPIDGGIEIRAKGEDKGKVFTMLMQNKEAGAYSGDDVTDEDVFRAIRYNTTLSEKAIGLLVREDWKHPKKPISDAAIQLKPPHELLSFMDRLGEAAQGIGRVIMSLPSGGWTSSLGNLTAA